MTYRNSNTVRSLAAALAAALVAVVALDSAHADPQAQKTIKQIEQKNREAMENYDLLDYEAAKKGLNEALALAKRKRLERHPVKAQTHLYLGIIEFSGFGDQESAMLQFMEAVDIDAKVEVPAAYRTKELTALLESARTEVGRTAGGGGGSDSGIDCDSLMGMQHTLVDTAGAGADRELEAFVAADVDAARVNLFYRPQGDDTFTEVKMTKQGECRYVGSIPGDAIQGDFLHYYVAATNKSGKVLASKGSAGSPNIIEVASGGGGGGGFGIDDENPLGGGGGGGGGRGAGDDRDDEVEPEGPSSRGLFLSLAIGSGGGYVTGETESTSNEVGCCFAPALFHVFPEVGYFLSERTSVSLAFRVGFPIGANITGHSTGAPAGLVRLRHALSEDGNGLTVSGTLGAGVMRNTITLTEPANDDPEMDTDTVALGPGIVGVGAGYLSPLGGPILFNAEINALAGIPIIDEFSGVEPQFGVQFDVNVGLIFAF